MRTWFVLVMMAAVALSGCASEGTGFEPTSDPIDDGAGGNETVDSVDAGDGASGAAENGTEAVENLVPVLSFTADIVNGTAPLLVNFTIDAKDDSEELSWVLSIDGNDTYTGTEVPAVVNHTFDEGAYNVTLTLTDGEHEVAETVSLSVAEGAPALLTQQFETVSYSAGSAGCGSQYGTWAPGLPAAGIFYGEFTVDAATYGQTWTIENTYTEASPFGWVGLSFYDADDALLSGAAAFFPETSVGGVVPEGAVYAVVYDCFSADVSVDYSTDGLLA